MPPILQCRDVSAGYPTPEGMRVLFSGLDLKLEQSQRLLVVGRSGSGKSTLLRLLNRFVEPIAGEIRFDGRPLPEHDVLSLRRRVCLLLQTPVMFEGHVMDNVLEHSSTTPAIDPERARGLLLEVGIVAELHQRAAADLSGGEKQRVALARALLREPEVLLLDEPTSALDPATSVKIAQLLRRLQARLGFCLVIVTHSQELLGALPGEILGLHAGGTRLGLERSDVEPFLQSGN